MLGIVTAVTGYIILFAAEASSSGGGIPYFGEAVVAVSIVGILGLFWKIQRSLINPLQSDVNRLRRGSKETRLEERLCSWRLGKIVDALNQGTRPGIDIMFDYPPWYKNERAEIDKDRMENGA
jgi:hypothetical protein